MKNRYALYKALRRLEYGLVVPGKGKRYVVEGQEVFAEITHRTIEKGTIVTVAINQKSVIVMSERVSIHCDLHFLMDNFEEVQFESQA